MIDLTCVCIDRHARAMVDAHWSGRKSPRIGVRWPNDLLWRATEGLLIECLSDLSCFPQRLLSLLIQPPLSLIPCPHPAPPPTTTKSNILPSHTDRHRAI